MTTRAEIEEIRREALLRLAIDPNDEEARAALHQVTLQTDALDTLEAEDRRRGPI
jgi:hypothetical protein